MPVFFLITETTGSGFLGRRDWNNRQSRGEKVVKQILRWRPNLPFRHTWLFLRQRCPPAAKSVDVCRAAVSEQTSFLMGVWLMCSFAISFPDRPRCRLSSVGRWSMSQLTSWTSSRKKAPVKLPKVRQIGFPKWRTEWRNTSCRASVEKLNASFKAARLRGKKTNLDGFLDGFWLGRVLDGFWVVLNR